MAPARKVDGWVNLLPAPYVYPMSAREPPKNGTNARPTGRRIGLYGSQSRELLLLVDDRRGPLGRTASRTGGCDSRRTLFHMPCDAAGVATCLSSRRDGFESRTGRWTRAVADRPADLLNTVRRQVRLLPARRTWFRGAARSARRAHIAEVAGPNPAGTTVVAPVAQRRRRLPDVEETPQVRVLPGVLTDCGVDWRLDARTASWPCDAGSNPASATRWSGSVEAARRPGKRGRPGSTPGRTSARVWGRMYRGGEGASQAPCDGFDSHRLH